VLILLAIILGVVTYHLVLKPYERIRDRITEIERRLTSSPEVEIAKLLDAEARRCRGFRRFAMQITRFLVVHSVPPWLAVRLAAAAVSTLVAVLVYAISLGVVLGVAYATFYPT